MSPPRLAWICALALSLSAPDAALAETPHHRNAISHEPFAMMSRGVFVQYERLVLPKVSLVGGLGARFAARDDFSSHTTSFKLEARWWLAADAGMTGTYVGVASVAARTSVYNRRYDRDLGAIWRIEESLRIGYRFVVFGFQEITPSMGLNVIHDFDERGRLAPLTYVTLGVNLTIGWMF